MQTATLKKLLKNVKEKAEQAKEKLGEAASKVFSEENKAKLDDAVQKVAGYNKKFIIRKNLLWTFSSHFSICGSCNI